MPRRVDGASETVRRLPIEYAEARIRAAARLLDEAALKLAVDAKDHFSGPDCAVILMYLSTHLEQSAETLRSVVGRQVVAHR